MVNKDILDFIRAQEAQGVSRFTIRHALLTQGGWSMGNIEEAFAMIPLTQAQALQPQQTYTTETLPPAVVTEIRQSSGNGGLIVITVFVTLFVTVLILLLAVALIPDAQDFLMRCVGR